MSHKRNEALRHVQHSMHHVIAAGEGSDRAPDSCKLCPYYRPDFKFRTCLYAHCPYKKQVNVFRSTPEKWDILYKLVQEAIRMILEAIYEPIFSIYSHGFRPGRSCHTALAMIKHEFTGAKWFIEGDIKGCFDNIDHSTLIGVLNRKIKDARFLNLIRLFLKSGYMEDWDFHETYSGCPQGGIISPIESLERRIQEAEAAEVNEMVRTAKVTPEQLAALLRQSATSTPNPAALSAVGATFNKEDDSNEDDE